MHAVSVYRASSGSRSLNLQLILISQHELDRRRLSCQARAVAAAYNRTAAAALTLSDPTFPRSGIDTTASQADGQEHREGRFWQRDAIGACEVLISSPNHRAPTPKLPRRQVEQIVDPFAGFVGEPEPTEAPKERKPPA